MQFTQIEELVNQDRLSEALEEIDRIEQPDSRNCKQFKNKIFNQLGDKYRNNYDYDQALNFYEKRIILCKELKNELEVARSLNIIGHIYSDLRDFDKAMDYYQRCLTIREEIADKLEIASSLSSIGFIYSLKGRLDKGLDFLHKGLKLKEEVDDKLAISFSYGTIGLNYYFQGELGVALEYLLKSLKIKRKLGSKRNIAWALNDLGNVYLAKGKFDQALDFFHESLSLFEEIDDLYGFVYPNGSVGLVFEARGEYDRALYHFKTSLDICEKQGRKYDIAHYKLVLGIINHNKGNLKQAINFFQRCLEIREEIGNDRDTSNVLFNMIITSIERKSKDDMVTYFGKLENLNKKSIGRSTHKYIRIRTKLANAMILKNSNRIMHKVDAQRLFQKILDETSHTSTTICAMLNLTELLLDELKIYGHEEVFEEVKILLSNVYEISQDQNSFSLLVEILILQSKFSTIEGNLTQAIGQLEEAKKIAEEKELNGHITKVLEEQERMEQELDKWRELNEQAEPIQKKIEHARLKNYLDEMLKLKLDAN